jgi:hypothetical protein
MNKMYHNIYMTDSIFTKGLKRFRSLFSKGETISPERKQEIIRERENRPHPDIERFLKIPIGDMVDSPSGRIWPEDKKFYERIRDTLQTELDSGKDYLKIPNKTGRPKINMKADQMSGQIGRAQVQIDALDSKIRMMELNRKKPKPRR